MAVTPQVVVVIPCFNESQRLQGAEFVEFAAARPHLRFLFVNDGSTDTTLLCLRAICSDLPDQLQAHDLRRNQGKAEAVRQGLLTAMELSADLVGYWDADLATPLAAIDLAIDVLARHAEFDVVAGIRLPLLGHTIQRKPLRRWLGRNFARCASQALRLSMFDTQCGAKMLRSGETLRWVLAQPFQSRWIFDVELLVRWQLFLQHAGEPPLASRLFEMPLEHWTDVPGSHLKPSDFLKAFGELWAIYRRYVFAGSKLPWPLPTVETVASPATLPIPIVPRRRAA